jgi:hypothetical protein
VNELVEWLLLQIAEDEAQVKHMTREMKRAQMAPIFAGNPPGWWAGVDIFVSPQRWAAECEAKREIVTRYEYSCAQSDSHRALGTGDDGWEKIAGGLELCVLSLARPYADREGYRQEWLV